MSYLPFVRLGLRLCRGGGPAGLVRLVLQAAAVAFGAFVLLATLAAPGVAERQDGRIGDREPVLAASAGTAGCFKLRTVEDNVGSRPLRRVAVWNATAQSPRPPGVLAWPAAGEIVVSPALAELIGDDARAAARFPQRVVGVVGPAGLVAPDELLAYVGVPAAEADRAGGAQCVERIGTQIRHRGASWTGAVEEVLRPAVLVPVGMAVFVLIPLGIFLAASARLSAATRERRLAALRLLGADARQTQVVNAVETGAVAAVGAAIGTAGWLAARGGTEQLNLGHLHWFAEDLALSPFTVAMTTVGLPLYAVAVATGAFARLRGNPLHAFRNAASRRPALLRIAPITCGVALLAGAAALPATRAYWALLAFAAGLVLTAVGLPLVTPLLVQTMWQRLNRRPGLPPALRIAGRRALASDGAAARLVATVGVTLFAAGIGLGAAEHVRLAESLATPSAPAQLKLTLDGAVNPTVLDALRATPGIRGASQYEYASAELGAEQRADVMIASCADVRGLFDGAEACSPERVYRLHINSPDFAGEPQLPAGTTLRLTPAAETDCPAARTVVAPADKLELTPKLYADRPYQLLITTAANCTAAQTTTVLLRNEPPVLERARQILATQAPASNVQGFLGTTQGLGGATVTVIIGALMAITLLLCLAALVVVAVDRLIERRRLTAALRVVGVPRRTEAAADMAEVALPLVISAGLAMAATAGAVHVAIDITGVTTRRFGEVLLIQVGLTATAVVLLTAVVYVGTLLRTSSEDLRRE
ncbi:FtsX-like permease family protein [Micromonospora sp. CPCC 205546]|uniref:FtsX-like permease family protein n=1 Tax=Micromonospora echinofusca TaxID=47858 RepID=A0A1C5GBI2_MICEH|nr:FtsX-like permease family protein [Micromonospora echinofusca]SCG16486.1 FtsX-like permease family protein [Micromonospora echinofusca]